MPTSREQDFDTLSNRLKPFMGVLVLCSVIISLAFPQIKTVFVQFNQISPTKVESLSSTNSWIIKGLLIAQYPLS